MYRLFAVTLLVSASLLFCVQPMVAKMILPLLGGTPAVWNTCMVFFQLALLIGYLYAHGLTGWAAPRMQVLVHFGVVLAPLLVLPIALSPTAQPPDDTPVWWLFGLLAGMVGLPFLVVATSAPLLQKWYAGTGETAAANPYFLYAASNLGSMAALVGYPVVIEPLLRLPVQAEWWRAGYLILAGLIAACGVAVWRSARPSAGNIPVLPGSDETAFTANLPLSSAIQTGEMGRTADPAASAAITKDETGITADPLSTAIPTDRRSSPAPSERKLTVGRRLWWVALAFAPSGLMLAVTTHVTTDIASVPLLWVGPLALYLLSFIIVFSRRQLVAVEWMWLALPVATLVVVFLFMSGAILRSWQVPLHWLILLIAAWACHGQLARDRPPARQLTEFYLWMSVGGVLGGAFAALLAPLLFRSGILEYPLLLVLACMLRPGPTLWRSSSLERWLDLIVPLAIAAFALVMVMIVQRQHQNRAPSSMTMTVILGSVTFVCFLCYERPWRYGLSVGLAMLVLSAANLTGLRNVLTERNFFGVVRVMDDPSGRFRFFMHGTTLHGMQELGDDGRPVVGEPISYFTRTGPIGQIFEMFNARASDPSRPRRVAIAGLGVGALAGYAEPFQEWDYYEIDPAVKRVAWDSGLFTYLSEAQRYARLDCKIGDARLRLREAPPDSYDIIVLDAFSSDSVPPHLLTLEAVQMYLTKLRPEGLLVFNVTNRYLDLEPVLANVGASADPPLVVYARDGTITQEELEAGGRSSHWVVMARQLSDLGNLPSLQDWRRLEPRGGDRVWTDDYSNLLGVFRWR